MSRFPELFEEAIEEVVGSEALHVEALAEHIARHIVGRQSALRAEARITAQWPVRRTTPVSKLSTQEMVSLVGIAAATADRVRRVVGVEATGINACPCAQGLVRGRAAERLARGGLRGRRADPRPRPARDAQPARSRDALRRHRAPAGRERPGRDRAGVDERADLRAAEAAGRALRRRARPPAAAVRRGLGAALDQGRARRDARASPTATSSSPARSTSRRSTRTTSSPSARARSASSARSSQAARRRPAHEPRRLAGRARLSLEAALGPGAQAGDVALVQDEHGDARDRGEHDHRPRLTEREPDERQRDAAVTIEASEA